MAGIIMLLGSASEIAGLAAIESSGGFALKNVDPDPHADLQQEEHESP